MSERRISGRVVHRGTGLADCQVLAADPAAGAVVADTETGAGGEWELTVPGERELLAVARCRGAAIGLASAPAAEGAPIELDVGATHDLTIRLEGDELPDWARPIVGLMPLHLDGRDDGLLRWITAPVREFSGGPLARITAAERTLVRALQPGTWWIAASVEHVPDALTPGKPADLRLATVQATAAGRELPAVRGGYTFALDDPLEVVLTLAPRR